MKKPIGRTPRSTLLPIEGVFTDIRNLFANMPEAEIRGYKPGRFSFNVKGGRCETCHGGGMQLIEMNFLRMYMCNVPHVMVNVTTEKRWKFVTVGSQLARYLT